MDFNSVCSPGTSRKAITVGASCKPQDIGVDPSCNDPIASFSSRGPINLGEEVILKPDIFCI